MLRKKDRDFRVNVVWANGVDTNHYFYTAGGAHAYISEIDFKDNAIDFSLFQEGELVAKKAA